MWTGLLEVVVCYFFGVTHMFTHAFRSFYEAEIQAAIDEEIL